jgi:hypothetical protein
MKIMEMEKTEEEDKERRKEMKGRKLVKQR